MPDLVETLEKETEVALSWLGSNEMNATPEKLHAILLRKNRTDTSREPMNIMTINDKRFKSEENVKLLELPILWIDEFDWK